MSDDLADPQRAFHLLLQDAFDLVAWCVHDGGRVTLRTVGSAGGRTPLPPHLREGFALAIDELRRIQLPDTLRLVDSDEGYAFLDAGGWSGRQLELKLTLLGETRDRVRGSVGARAASGMPVDLFLTAARGYAALLRGFPGIGGTTAVLALLELILAVQEEQTVRKSSGPAPIPY